MVKGCTHNFSVNQFHEVSLEPAAQQRWLATIDWFASVVSDWRAYPPRCDWVDASWLPQTSYQLYSIPTKKKLQPLPPPCHWKITLARY